jgi:hypothetical protein
MDIEWLYCIANGAGHIKVSFKIRPLNSTGALATTDGRNSCFSN